MPITVRATVIIVTYDSREVIRSCLDALLATIGADDEVVVVDNDSTDGTADVIAAYGPPVRLLRADSNLGFGGGANLGARAARGAKLVFLNPDTQPRPDWIEALLIVLAENDDRVLVSPKLLLTREPGRVDALGNNLHISGIATARRWGELAARHSSREEVGAISGACFAVSRDIFAQLGGFDERFFLYCEDTELSLRARLAGYRCLATASAEVLHDHRPGVSAAKLYYLERNRWWMLLKLYRWRTILGLVPVLVLAEAGVWAMAILAGPSHVGAKARAWIGLLRWLPGLNEARRVASRNRTLPDRAIFRLHDSRLPFAQVATGRLARFSQGVSTASFAVARAVAELVSS